MSPTFTTDDVGKTVESAAGEALGIIASVDDETAYVEPDPGATDSIKATLDWESSPGDAVPLPDDSVHRVTDDAIRLESTFPEESITSGTTDDDEGSDEGFDRSEQRDVDDFIEATGKSLDSDAEMDIDETGATTGDDLDESEPMMDDERYETVDDGPQMDPDEEVRDLDDGRGRTEETASAEELESVEDEASRGLEVDPTELTDDDPEAEIAPEEDVGQRTDARVDPDDIRDEGSESGEPTMEDGEEE